MTINHSHRSAGVTLIELLVALAIGAVLMLGLVQVFAASRSAYQMSEGMARVQENSRFAMDFIQRDLRMAGHFGCSTDQAHMLDDSSPGIDRIALHFPAPIGFPLDFNVSIQGYEAAGTAPGDDVVLGEAEGAWAPELPPEVAGLEPLPGSDILVLRYLYGEGVPVDALAADAGQTTITIAPARWDVLTEGGHASPELFALSDCHRADVFLAAGAAAVNPAAGTVVTDSEDVGLRYDASDDGTGAYAEGQLRLFRAESIVYYVGTGTSGRPALFRARSDGGAYQPMELVEGIESMQALFGRDTSATGPRGYVTAHDTAETLDVDADEWLRVGMVQVGFLARSPDRALADAASDPDRYPNVLGVRFDPTEIDDANYRSAYEVTVALRNRLFGN